MNKTAGLQLLTRGSSQGFCNICHCFGTLTEDHVPPKGVGNVRQVDLFRLVDLLEMPRPTKVHKRFSQNGLSYKTLCARCNNALLGARYDPELIRLSNSIAAALKTSLVMPAELRVVVKPGLVARAVLGHLMAVGLGRTERTDLLDAARSFVMDESLPLPDGIEIYLWVHPYREQVVIRDAGMLLPSGLNVVFWCLKFFPVGFFVTWRLPKADLFTLPRLSDYMLHAGGYDAAILMPLWRLPFQHWPEAPVESSAILYCEDSALGIQPR